MCDLGEIYAVPLREKWKNEAENFTPWLERNIKILSDALKLEFEVIGREVKVGEFSTDLVVRTDDQRIGIIENQYGNTNHDHLGKLLTYAGGQDASIVIWISEHIREEHRGALDWMNRTSVEIQYFGVELSLIKIDDSRAAPIFRPVVFPNEWRRHTKRSVSTNITPRNQRYQWYFQKVIDQLEGFGNALPTTGSRHDGNSCLETLFRQPGQDMSCHLDSPTSNTSHRFDKTIRCALAYTFVV